jgi:integrase
MKSNTVPYRRADRDGWWATVYDAGGKRRRVRLDATTYEEACVARARLVDRARLVREGLVSQAQVDANDARVRRVAELAAEMIAEPRMMKRSAEWRRQVKLYLDKLAVQAPTLADLDARACRRFVDGYVRLDRSACTINHILGKVRMFARWCVQRGYLTADPTEGIRGLNAEADRRQIARALTHAELASLVAACPSPERRARYLLGARAGLRQEECSRLLWGDVDLEGGWLRLGASRTKSRRSDDLPLHAEAADALRALPRGPSSGRVFPRRLRRLVWLRDLRRAGLVVFQRGEQVTINPQRADGATGYRDDRGRVLSIQCLRKTYGTHLAQVEPNIATVAKLMRHTNPKLTLHLYSDARLLDLRGSLSKLAPPTGASQVPVQPRPVDEACNTVKRDVVEKTA